MRKILLIIGFVISLLSHAQNDSVTQNSLIDTRTTSTPSNSGDFYVGGNADTYYPVVFQDNSWTQNKATVLEIGHSHVHKDSNWNGSLIATFRFHAIKHGNGSNFIDADIKQNNQTKKDFIQKTALFSILIQVG